MRGGDIWDQNIRQHIRECKLFIAVISRSASEREEGYYRFEWKLAVDRSHLMAPDQPFILPIVFDETSPSAARVPDRFHDYHWTRMPGGAATPEFAQRVAVLAAGTQPQAPAAHVLGRQPPSSSSFSPRRKPTRLWGSAGVLLVAALAVWLNLARHAPIRPYSAQDRRITFAALPPIPPAGNNQAQELTAANTDACETALERNTTWAHAADRVAVQTVTAQPTNIGKIALALDGHFLIRGTISRKSGGFSIELAMLDGDMDRTLGTETKRCRPPLSSPPVPTTTTMRWEHSSTARRRKKFDDLRCVTSATST